MKSPQSNFLIYAFLISVLVHLIFIISFRYISEDLGSRIDTEKPVMVQLKSVQPRRIADIAKPKTEQEAPENPSAEGLYNQNVKEETVAPRTKPSPPSQTGSPTIVKKASPANTPEKTAPIKETPKKDEKVSQQDVTQKTAQKEVENKKLEKQRITIKKEKEEVKKEEKIEKTEPKSLKELFAQRGEEQKKNQIFSGKPGSQAAPPSQNNAGDYYPDYKIGNRTYLNVRGNPHISYFVELKRKFEVAWNPVRAVRPYIAEIQGQGKLEVVCGISISRSGQLSQLIFIQQSTLDAYDKEAQRTVQISAPFSAPPDHLLKEDGQLHVAFGFTLYF